MILGYDELPQEIKKYIPDYEYLIYDLTKYEDEDIVELIGLTKNEIDKIRKDMLQ